MQEETELQKSRLNRFIAFAGVVVITAASLIFFVLTNSEKTGLDWLYITGTCIVSCVIIAYAYLLKDRVFINWKRFCFSAAFFVLPLILLISVDSYINFPVWMLGGILIAGLIDTNLGLFTSYLYILSATHLENNTLKGFIITLLTISLVCLLFRFVKNFITALYLVVTVSAATLVISLIVNKLVIHDSFSTLSFNLIIAYVLMIFFTILCRVLLKGTLDMRDETVKEAENDTEENTETGFSYLNRLADETNSIDYSDELKTIHKTEESKVPSEETVSKPEISDEELLPYCDEAAPLLAMLKEKKKSVFLHSVRVSRLAVKCADGLTGVNSLLVRAGSLYSQIGKSEAGDSYENTLRIIKDNCFPYVLVECISSSAQKDESGAISKEAAIITITDRIVSTYYYLKNQNSPVYPEKLVDSVIGKEVTHGRLNASGLSLKDINYIREYFVETINSLEKGRK